jgi:hypothetical protein
MLLPRLKNLAHFHAGEGGLGKKKKKKKKKKERSKLGII